MTSAFPSPKLRAKEGVQRPRLSGGSLTRRMIVISAIWILLLLGVGGYALDRVLTGAITRNFDASLDYVLTALIASPKSVRPARHSSTARPRTSGSSSPIPAFISRSAPCAVRLPPQALSSISRPVPCGIGASQWARAQ
jgi:hypothetical protein